MLALPDWGRIQFVQACIENGKETEIEEQILELGRLVAELRERDRERRVFGAGGHFGHRYVFCPPLPEWQIKVFESNWQIALPADYRLFLALVGNGGAGPYYGLMSLDIGTKESDLRNPFPWTAEVDLTSENYPVWNTYPGIIQLCHIGCGGYCFWWCVERLMVKYGVMPRLPTSCFPRRCRSLNGIESGQSANCGPWIVSRCLQMFALG